MPKLTTVGFEPPSDFPVEAYETVHLYLTKYKDTNKAQWQLFSLGWNGLAYRYRALVEYDQESSQLRYMSRRHHLLKSDMSRESPFLVFS